MVTFPNDFSTIDAIETVRELKLHFVSSLGGECGGPPVLFVRVHTTETQIETQRLYYAGAVDVSVQGGDSYPMKKNKSA